MKSGKREVGLDHTRVTVATIVPDSLATGFLMERTGLEITPASPFGVASYDAHSMSVVRETLAHEGEVVFST